MKVRAGMQKRVTTKVCIIMYKEKCCLPMSGFSASFCERQVYGNTKLMTVPIGTAILPTAVAMARSLSPNQVDAILLGMFIKKGYPIAATIAPMK